MQHYLKLKHRLVISIVFFHILLKHIQIQINILQHEYNYKNKYNIILYNIYHIIVDVQFFFSKLDPINTYYIFKMNNNT